MKGKLDLIILDPPLTPLMIDRYQKKKEKKPIWKEGTEGIHRPIKKPYSKSSRKEKGKSYFSSVHVLAVMEMINPSPVHIKKKKLLNENTALIHFLKRYCSGNSGVQLTAFSRALVQRST